MALRVARGCDDVATTRPCVRVPGVRVARLAGFDPKARSDLRSGQKRADTHGGASSATRRSERRAAVGLVCVPWIIAIESTNLTCDKTGVLAGALNKQLVTRLGVLYLPFRPFSAVEIRDGRRLSRSGQEPRHWPLRLCQWARPQLAPSLLGRPHSTVRPSQDCVPSSKDAFANGGGRHFAAAEAASP